jgi:hypothetical protein
MTNTNIREGSSVLFNHPELQLPFVARVDTVSVCGRYAKIVLAKMSHHPAWLQLDDSLLAAIDTAIGQDWNVSVRELTPA